MRLGTIEKRLAATLGMDAINGDSFERGVVANQIKEAVGTIRELRDQRDGLKAQLHRMVTYYEPGETRPEALGKISDAKAAIAKAEGGCIAVYAFPAAACL